VVRRHAAHRQLLLLPLSSQGLAVGGRVCAQGGTLCRTAAPHVSPAWVRTSKSAELKPGEHPGSKTPGRPGQAQAMQRGLQAAEGEAGAGAARVLPEWADPWWRQWPAWLHHWTPGPAGAVWQGTLAPF
jgi:hypothetical protein